MCYYYAYTHSSACRERGYTLDALDRCLAMRPQLVAAVTRYCGDREVAEEAVQETLLAAFQQGERLETIESHWGWLWRVAVNRVNSHHRRAATERRAIDRMDRPADDVPDAADAIATILMLTHLSERYRLALWLRLVEQRSVSETAAMMSCAEGTVKSLTHRGAARLRDVLAA